MDSVWIMNISNIRVVWSPIINLFVLKLQHELSSDAKIDETGKPASELSHQCSPIEEWCSASVPLPIDKGNISSPFSQGGAPKIAKLVYNSNNYGL